MKGLIDKILEVSVDVICVVDGEGKFHKVSTASYRHWGYQPKELEGSSFWDLVHPDDVESTKIAGDSIKNGEELTFFENRYIKKDGEIAYNLWSARIDPETKFMYCIARDALDKLNNERMLRESEMRFKALVQDGSDLIGILDMQGNYKYVSHTSIAILGIHPNEFLGKNAFDFIHPDDKDRVLSSLVKIENEPKVTVDPFRFKNSKGEWRLVETVLTNMLNHPLIKGIVANSRDITEQSEKLQRIAWRQSHIVRAPLARMLGLINLIEIESYKPDDLAVLMTHFKNSLLEMDLVIMDIINDAQLLKSKKPSND